MDKFHLDGNLSERDFEFLHQKIFEASNTDISTTTLRRIWSNNHQNLPQTKTLDALAITLGFNGWHEFKIAKNVNSETKPPIRVGSLVIITIPILLILATFLSYSALENNPPHVTLVAEKTTHNGVPATIGFHYDISDADDPIQIQLSWNPYEQTTLDPAKSFNTGTYFYPDYHEAKLLLDTIILATQNVHITTDDWHGLIMKSGYDTNPVYLEQDDFISTKKMSVTDSLANASSISQPEPYYPVFTLSNENLDSLSGDNFQLAFSTKLFETSVNMNCRSVDILVKGETGKLRIPIMQSGCYGVANMTMAEKNLSGKTTDLSSLTANLSEKTDVLVINSNQQLSVSVGENEPFIIEYSEGLGPIKVIKFVLLGPGEISGFDVRNRPLKI